MTQNGNDFERDTMSLDELRKRMGISPTVAYALANRNALPIPIFRIGRQFRASRRAWENLMNQQHGTTEQEAGSDAA